DVLGVPLHHEPSRGGAGETGKDRAMYEATLAAYREVFSAEPPADIWPPIGQRFGDDLQRRTVDTSRNWIVPKRPIQWLLRAAVLLVAAVLLPGCDGGLNPFALHGTDFFYVLIPAMIGAVCLGRVFRSRLWGPGPEAGDDQKNLTWEQAAYLAGGY